MTKARGDSADTPEGVPSAEFRRKAPHANPRGSRLLYLDTKARGDSADTPKGSPRLSFGAKRLTRTRGVRNETLSPQKGAAAAKAAAVPFLVELRGFEPLTF